MGSDLLGYLVVGLILENSLVRELLLLAHFIVGKIDRVSAMIGKCSWEQRGREVKLQAGSSVRDV